ncbi:MAG TPA: D-alanyl-D-alanine carboxypeptidase family protein [Symbiobacteriaceae bacterium]
MDKKVVTGAAATLLWLAVALPALAGSPVTHARGVLLLDGVSGQVLYQQNGYVKAYPASTTKLLTALVAVEHGKLDQVIEISGKAVDLPLDSSSCYLERGEKQKLEYLLYGLLLSSGNDCAQAIAEGVGGGKPDQFVAWMNETARRIGATHSNFTNPHGLHDAGHYTTPLDLALIARTALANPTLLKIAGTKEFYWPGKSDRNGPYYNHDAMLSRYDGTMGGKTGFTEEAGLTLVVEAKRGNRLLVGVVMGENLAATQYNDMIALLDYGYGEFEQKPLFAKGTPFGTVPVTGGKAPGVSALAGADFLVSVPRGGQPAVTIQPKLPPNVAAPVTAGQQVGALEVREGDRLLATVPVLPSQAVLASPLTGILHWAGLALKWLALAFLGLLVFRAVVRAVRRALRRRRSRRRADSFDGRTFSSRNSATSAYRSRNRY